MVVDASVWVSFFVPSDVHHAVSRQWLQQHTASGGLLIEPTLVTLEVAGAISRRIGRPEVAHQAVRQVQRISALRLIPLDQHLGTLATHLAADLALRGADAVYVALAYQLGIPLVTWDDEQRTRATTIIATQTP
jgi:predicted nucleic acid-binding protein